MAVATRRQSTPPEVAPAVELANRAGRNLPAAIAVGVALGVVILVTLFTSRAAFVVVIVVAIAVGAWEVVRAAEEIETRVPLPPLLAGSVLIIVSAYLRGSDALVFALVSTCLACFTWRLADGGGPGYVRDVSASVLVVVYVPFLGGFAALLTSAPDGAARVIAFIVTSICMDIGGYAAGVVAGRHPMAPSISPKKSWEGFAGGLTACVVSGVAFLALVFHVAVWQGLAFGVAVGLAAMLGDLGQSMIKRDLGIKDMGSLLPGHGGLMERLDSLLLAAPVAWLLLTVFARVG
ncbi:MAG: phosphatidate cytidylyltransferase [Mycobacteriales bacterium]|nr:phosphatidate cytidylyltransferase [Frankia sp.]